MYIKKIFEYICNDKTEKSLYELLFKCPFYKQGCIKILEYNDYFKHMNECQYKNLIYESQVKKYNF